MKLSGPILAFVTLRIKKTGDQHLSHRLSLSYFHDPAHTCEPIQRVVISDPREQLFVVESMPPRCQDHLGYGPKAELPQNVHGRTPDDIISVSSWLASSLLLHALPHAQDIYYSNNDINTQLQRELFSAIQRLSCSDDVLILALYYFRRLCPIRDRKHNRDYIQSDCVSVVAKLYYVSVILACHWLAELDSLPEGFRSQPSVTLAQENKALSKLEWNLFVSRRDWECWLRSLLHELQPEMSPSLHPDRSHFCQAIVVSLLDKALL